jgi:hypothetical protein
MNESMKGVVSHRHPFVLLLPAAGSSGASERTKVRPDDLEQDWVAEVRALRRRSRLRVVSRGGSSTVNRRR